MHFYPLKSLAYYGDGAQGHHSTVLFSLSHLPEATASGTTGGQVELSKP